MTYTCIGCNQEYVRWQGIHCKNPKYCQSCSDIRHTPKAGTITPCILCGDKFPKPTGRNGSRVFCSSCYDIIPSVRNSMMRQKRAGITVNKEWIRSQKLIDRTEYMSVINFVNLPVEKLIRKYNDPNLRLIRTMGTKSEGSI